MSMPEKSEGRMVCPNCGQPIEPIAKFCRKCGAPQVVAPATAEATLPPLPPEPVATTPVAPQPRPPSPAVPTPMATAPTAPAQIAAAPVGGIASTLKRFLAQRWAIPALAAVVVLAVVTGVLLLQPAGGSPTTIAPVVPATPDAPASSPPAGPAASEPAEQPGASQPALGTSEPPPAEPEPVEFTCWNGKTVAEPGDCARPHSDAQAYEYLEYVYPGLAAIADRCERKKTPEKYSDVAAYINCPGDGVTNVRYRYWRDLDDAEGHYSEDDKEYDGAEPFDVYLGDEGVEGWVRAYNVPEDGILTVTMFLPDQHLSLSVEGRSTRALWAQFEKTTIRPIDEILGYRSEGEPSMTVLARG